MRKLENETLLAQINDAYADHPDAQEQEEQQRMWQLQRRRLAAQEW